MANYTAEQIKDITEREAKALAFLKEQQLTPSAVVQKINIGDDVFVDKVVPYLQDIKYAPTPSPIQKVDLSGKGAE